MHLFIANCVANSPKIVIKNSKCHMHVVQLSAGSVASISVSCLEIRSSGKCFSCGAFKQGKPTCTMLVVACLLLA